MTTLPPAGKGRNIILTGFMGTGKTTVGRLLAELLDFDFVDTDALIEHQHGPIHSIFAEQGEQAFRTIERQTAAALADRQCMVIATGGRLMLDPANVSALSRNGRTFCLVTTAADILDRVLADQSRVERPLLSVDDPATRVIDLLNERAPAYRRFAQVSTYRRRPDEIASELAMWATSTPDAVAMGDGSGGAAAVGPALLPLLRSIAGIDGPLVIVTNERDDSAFLAQCPVPDHLIMLPTNDHPERNDTASLSQIVRAALTGAGVDQSATIVALGCQETLEATATATVSLEAALTNALSDAPATGRSDGPALIHCPTELPARFDRYAKPSMIVVDVAILQDENTAGDLQALVTGATRLLQSTD